MTDTIVIGGGPAGISAALTLRQRNKSVVIVSSAPEDSPLYKAERVDNYPGLQAVSGKELLDALIKHAEDAGVEFVRGRAIAAMPMGENFGVSVGSDFLEGRSVILAIGAAANASFPGEREFLGAGVSYCATCDGMLYRGKRVAVIGLSAEAAGEAEFLRSIGCQVEYFDKSRAKKYEVRGNGHVEALVADGIEYPVECVFILRPGVAPDALVPGIELTAGKIARDAYMATTVPGVFACGDCTGTPYQVAKATGEGNVAGIYASKYLEDK